MNVIKQLLVLFAAALCATACTKNAELPPTPESIRIGIADGWIELNVQDSGSSIHYNGVPYKYFDVDNDQINDFKINSTWSGSSGGLQQNWRSIEVINQDFYISTAEVYDSTFRCTDTSNMEYTHYNSIWIQNWPVICLGQDSYTGLGSITCPEPYIQGDSIPPLPSWTQSKIYLTFKDASCFRTSQRMDYYRIMRGSWRNVEDKYVLFKKESGNKIRYGWFKLKTDGGGSIYVLEYAIQK